MSTDNVQTPMIIAKPVRRLKVGYVRRRYEDRRTGFTLRISRHASLTLKATGWNRRVFRPAQR